MCWGRRGGLLYGRSREPGYDPAVLMSTFIVFLSSLPPKGPGEGPDCHFPKEIIDFGPISARIRGGWLNLFCNSISDSDAVGRDSSLVAVFALQESILAQGPWSRPAACQRGQRSSWKRRGFCKRQAGWASSPRARRLASRRLARSVRLASVRARIWRRSLRLRRAQLWWV